MTCESCGCTMSYVAEGWDRWVECTNSMCDTYDWRLDDVLWEVDA